MPTKKELWEKVQGCREYTAEFVETVVELGSRLKKPSKEDIKWIIKLANSANPFLATFAFTIAKEVATEDEELYEEISKKARIKRVREAAIRYLQKLRGEPSNKPK